MDREGYCLAAERAEDYLLSHIERYGVWEDFCIREPGMSDQWVTAYVGNCLFGAPCRDNGRKRNALHKAADFLAGTKKADGGWGYNGNCRSDCDSTAHALLFLAKMKYPIDRKSIECICRFFRQDGGFATYRNASGGSWNDSHIDVTLPAAFLLKDVFMDNENARRRLLEYVSSWFGKYGLPPAFWWPCRYYTALAGFYFYERYGLEYPRDRVLSACMRTRPAGQAFEISLCLELLARLDAPVLAQRELAAELLSMQKEDGSFPGGEILRVTGPDCHAPWEHGGGQTMAEDVRSLFTTANAIRALSILRV